jgi:hypothetical protein
MRYASLRGLETVSVIKIETENGRVWHATVDKFVSPNGYDFNLTFYQIKSYLNLRRANTGSKIGVFELLQFDKMQLNKHKDRGLVLS